MANTKTVEQKRDIAQELRDDLETLKAAKRGEVQLRQRTFVQVSPPAEIRARLKLSQHDFARSECTLHPRLGTGTSSAQRACDSTFADCRSAARGFS